MTQRLKPSALKAYRQTLLQEQKNICALCNTTIADGEDVLDHDHKSGYVRAVLHRGCNALEGIITNALARNRITPERLAAIFANWVAYHQQQQDVLHPTHRTQEEKQARARRLAKKRRSLKTNKKL